MESHWRQDDLGDLRTETPADYTRYDNPHGLRSSWGDSSYAPLNKWLSIGGWFEPYPWNNSGQQSYVAQVQQHLAARDWPQ